MRWRQFQKYFYSTCDADTEASYPRNSHETRTTAVAHHQISIAQAIGHAILVSDEEHAIVMIMGSQLEEDIMVC